MRIKRPSKPKIVWVDTETTGISLWNGDMVYSVGILWGSLENPTARYFEWTVDPFTRICIPDPKDLEQIRFYLEDPEIVKCFHNAKFDRTALGHIGIKTLGRVEDTSFAARVCDTLRDGFRLKEIAWDEFDYPKEDMHDLKDIVKQLRVRAKKKGWKIGPGVEEDYWLCQWVDELMPELSPARREEIKAAVGVYCTGDCLRTALIWKNKYSKELDDQNYRQTYESELELLEVVLGMEARGMAVYKTRTKEQLDYCETKAARHLKRMHEMLAELGRPNPDKFNPGSPKQLGEVLYASSSRLTPRAKRGYGLEVAKTSNGGAPSTDWKALRPHQEHPFVRELLMYRSASKAVSTFFQKYLDIMRPDPITVERWKGKHKDVHVIHCSLNQCGTITGRFSSSDPNLQQVANPESSPRGTDVHARYPFGPRPGYNWYACDFAQMELRVFADIADVPGMLDTIWRGEDLNNHNTNMAWGGRNNPAALEAAAHALELGHDEPTREELQAVWDKFGWNASKAKHGMRSSSALELADQWLGSHGYDIVKAEKSVGKSQSRQRGKTVMFTKMYGGGAAAVTDLLFCSIEEASRFMKQFDKPFPEINRYIESASKRAERDGFIINRYGRKLRIDPRFSYRAVNYMIQGTCADLMKDGIRRCNKFLKEIEIDGHVLMTIHDELIFEIRKEHAYKWVLRELVRIMGDHEGRLRVPMPVEIKKCKESWERKESVAL